ncbi:MAG: protease pro-enzyme activation domain-containing protein [Gemmatimonadales bacterium]
MHNPQGAMKPHPRSHCSTPASKQVAEVDDNESVRLTIVLKPATPFDPSRFGPGRGLSREEFIARHAAPQSAIDRLTTFARAHGLAVEQTEPARHTVRLSGTFAQARSAFRPEHLGVYVTGGRRYIARGGRLFAPANLCDDIVAIMGFDRRPIAKPHFRIRRTANANAVSYDPIDVARQYQFPAGNGSGQTIALIELGGGFTATDVAAYFKNQGIVRTGTIASVSVDGQPNGGDADPNGADGEVQLDVDVAGSIAPGANLAVYFAPNEGNGFLDAVLAAVHDDVRSPSVISISWGGPENAWAAQDMDAMDQAFQAAAALNIAVCVASGDDGSTDGSSDGKPWADFPASSPHVLACGGTSLPAAGAETSWNDGAAGGASGGGYSKQFALPPYQNGSVLGKWRGVPDVAGNADPQTGYNVRVDGSTVVIGGTSAVAPLWAALYAIVAASLSTRVGLANAVLYANGAAFTDITTGNNGAYSAARGWDPVTGQGSPKGNAILAAVRASLARATAVA